MRSRSVIIQRKTKETEINLEFNLDGSGDSQIDTGIGFFDHMLENFCRHGFFDMKLSVKGDLHVDSHHTVEDTGIALGQAIKDSLGDKEGIVRYGSFILPMDETLILCAIDLSGRPYLVFDEEFTVDKVGNFDTELVKEFFWALTYNGGMNLHIKKMNGENNHHIIEATFKAFAKALNIGSRIDDRIKGVLSTKETIN